MRDTVIEAHNISKEYRLGVVGTKTLRADIARFFSSKKQAEDGADLVRALHGIDFTIQSGQAVGIVGKNGAGKSTLLKILSRVTAPTTGHIRVKGRIASLLEVGTGFHPELTGRENIFLNGAILGMSKAEIKQKMDEIIAFSGVARYIDTPVKRYSSGMYVRLAFAVAAHLESEILIMDEVLAVGDAEFQKKCLGKMNDVANKEGRTVLFVSHNMAAVSQLCQQAIFLKNGTLMKQGSVPEIIDLYLQADGSTAVLGHESSILKSAKVVKMVEVRDGLNLGTTAILEFELDAPEAGLGIELIMRHRETPILTASSAYHSDVTIEKGYQKLQVELGPLNLHLGRYDIDITITLPKVKVLETYDTALSIQVETQVVNNFYHAQFQAGPFGFLVPTQRWSKATKPLAI